jgi:hypothetical protein
MLPNLIKSHAILLPVLFILLQILAIICTDKQGRIKVAVQKIV